MAMDIERKNKELGSGNRRKSAQRWQKPVTSLGQRCPSHCPSPSRPPTRDQEAPGHPLGPPLSIRGVAELIGCSPWTVRQTLISRGLPVFRSGASGKLIFYTNQVVHWIEARQKGGTTTK